MTADGLAGGGRTSRTNVQTDILSGQMSERVEAVDRLTSCCYTAPPPPLVHGLLFSVELELKTDFQLAGCIKLYSRTSSGRKLHFMGVSVSVSLCELLLLSVSLNMIDVSWKIYRYITER